MENALSGAAARTGGFNKEKKTRTLNKEQGNNWNENPPVTIYVKTIVK